jgi:poly [ADP-ribose] polymerase 2/3/4
MGKFTVRKVPDNGNEGFTETLEYHVMHQANVSSNHNKFYLLELQRHPDGRFRLFTHYGRLGISNIYEVRDMVDGHPCTNQEEAKREFDSIHKKKLSGKSVKDPETGEVSREAYVDVEVVSPQVGSVNIRGVAEVKKTVTIKAAIDTSSYDPKISKLLDQLIAENVHSITSHTSIKYTAGGYSTELGPVTPAHVDRARIPLTELNKLMGSNGAVDPENRAVQQLNSQYFSLIPKPFSRKIAATDMILDAKALEAEFDVLDQLATAVSMGSAMSGSTSTRMNALGTDIEFLNDEAEVRRIKKYIRESKAQNHQGTDVWKFDVKNIYKIKIPAERARYDTAVKKFGNVQEVFHGSANSNILSILKGGLIIPPVTAGFVCGRLYGNGIYGANNSTKSLNYSIGYWGSRRSSNRNAFLFLADFALGKQHDVHDTSPGGPPRGYDSIWAHKKRSGYSGGLWNDELIVYSLPQCTLKYLVEME